MNPSPAFRTTRPALRARPEMQRASAVLALFSFLAGYLLGRFA